MPPKLTPADVVHIADLARLDLSPGEVDAMTRELSAIVDFAATVQRVDTSAVPAEGERPARAAGRTDDPAAGLSRADVLGRAPDAARDGSLFRVPKVR